MLKSEAGTREAVRITVRTATGAPAPHIETELQADRAREVQRTDSDGSAMFPPVQGPKKVIFRIPVYQAEFGPFPVDAASQNVVFEINGEAITQVPFKNERLKIAGSSLEMSFWNKDKPMRYRKQERP